MLHGTYHDELDPGSTVTLATLPTSATMGHYKKKLGDRLIPKPGLWAPDLNKINPYRNKQTNKNKRA